MVYILLSAKRAAYFCKSIRHTKMGGVSRYFSKVSGSGVDLTLLNKVQQGAEWHVLIIIIIYGRRRKKRKAAKNFSEKLQKTAKNCTPQTLELSGSHRLTHIASDLASRALASQAKPQRESESQAFRIARS